jgi:hypothetical protein
VIDVEDLAPRLLTPVVEAPAAGARPAQRCAYALQMNRADGMVPGFHVHEVRMVPKRRSLRLPPEAQRRLTLTLATAEERLIEVHTEAAREFVRVTQDELPYDRGLEIFFRLTATPARIREAVAVQTLASLAKEPTASTPLLDIGTGLRGFIQEFVRRLQGRRAEGLRTRVGRAAAAARDRIKGAYLQGASLVVQELKGEVEPAEAVQAYIEALDIGPGWGERIFHEAVAAMGDRDELAA